MVRFLLENGADVTFKKMPNETTALHEVVQAARWLDPRYADGKKIPAAMEVVKALVEKGADPNAPDKNGMTPLALAKQCKFPELAACLSDMGATS